MMWWNVFPSVDSMTSLGPTAYYPSAHGYPIVLTWQKLRDSEIK